MTWVYRFCYLVLLGLGCLTRAHGQGPSGCASTPQPDSTFYAVDVQTGKRVSDFCVGRPVRFDQTAGRNIPNNYLYYGVKAGTGAAADFPACTPSTTPNAPFVYTPSRTDVGTVTVAELTTAPIGSGFGTTYYIRTFQVHDNVPPAFTVAPCPSGNALVTITDATYASYTVLAGNALVLTIQPGQPKAQPVPLAGATSITVRGYYNSSNLCESLPSTQTIAPLLPAQIPLFTSLTLQAPLPGGAATLAVGQLPSGYIYTLQREAPGTPGVYTTVARVRAGSTSFPLGTVVANNGYRLLRADTCNGPTAASEQLYPISLRGTSTQNRNQLLFNDGAPAGSITGYTVTRDGTTIPVTAIAGGLEDATGACGTSYLYQVTATYRNGGKSISNEFTIRTQSDLLPPQPLLLASFNVRNVVELTPLLATNGLSKGSTLYYRKAGAPADFAKATTLRPARDSTALADLRAAPPCYSLRQVDACNNKISPESPPTCPALLSASPADADGSTAALTWTAFTGPNPSLPASYVLQRLAPDFTVLPGSVSVSGSTYTDLVAPTNRQVLRYRLQISGAGLPADTFSYSNIATVTRQLSLTIPTAFTPNGDGLNDVLEVKGKYLDNYTFVVVDRNGQEVFRGTKRADVWDGTIRGHAPVMGAYVWRFSQTNEDGSPFMATGAVTILK